MEDDEAAIPMRRVSLSPAAVDLLEGCCLRQQPARFAAQAILDQTGESFSERTIARRMAEWRARTARRLTLQHLGIVVAAMRGNEQVVQSLGTQFAQGGHSARADELVRTVQAFIRRPTPTAMAEVVLSCLVYQINAGNDGRREGSRA